MATQNVSLSERHSKFIRKSVHSGAFRNASEVVRAGLRLLEQEQHQNEQKLKVLRKMVKEGFDAIDRGEYETVTAETIPEFVKSLTNRGRKRAE